MKKLLVTGITVGVLAVGFGSYAVTSFLNKGDSVAKAAEQAPAITQQAAPSNQAKQIVVPLSENSDQDQVMHVMHEMTHQKVVTDNQWGDTSKEDKWGAIPMTKENIAIVKKYVDASNFMDKEKLQEILMRWEKNDFTFIVDEHNFFWMKEHGQVGKAIRKATPAEEKAFIQRNFENK
ncbi:DUF6241 domain-containing protein [Priestia megaterium]|uniref:DUF6241 domain-containing protein n=1 Tax=Priestia megaterium TaxID=1404 RepID=UPI000BED3CC0|nr:DUF6241 domain-containing protein [Priestia megaterium]PED64024.1 hypothetical protein CON20_23970 [Priestia megaterium]